MNAPATISAPTYVDTIPRMCAFLCFSNLVCWNCRMFQIECINEPIVKGIKRCIQENPAGYKNLSVIGEVINNAEKAMISIKETQIRPMSLCCLVPFFVKKIYIPTGIADSAKKACVYIIDMVISPFELFKCINGKGCSFKFWNAKAVVLFNNPYCSLGMPKKFVSSFPLSFSSIYTPIA